MKLEVPSGYELMGQALVPKNSVPVSGDRLGWGEVVGLSVGVTAWGPNGKLLSNMDRKSRSFLRWFGKFCRGIFEGVNQTVKNTSNSDVSLRMASGASSSLKVIPIWKGAYTASSYGVTGAALGIGTGISPPGEESNFYNLKASYAVFDAKVAVVTTTEDTSKIEYTITEGLTITASGGILCSEVAVFSRMNDSTWNTDNMGTPVMMAYDEIAFPYVSVPAGGVIAPRYTITFTA